MKAWRYATGGVLIGTAAIIALYFEDFAGLVSVWSASAAHRFLFVVPGLFLYFAWLRVPAIVSLQPRPSALGLLYAAPFCGLWLVAEAAQLSVAAQLAAVGLLQAVFLTLLGWPICRVLLFPLALLWLMVPFADALIPLLTELTTLLTVAGLRAIGLTVTTEGNLLTAGGARYAIVPGCSGFDFLVGNLLVSLVFANLLYRRTIKRCLYVLAAVPVAILANNLRTISVIVITAATGRSIDLASDHQAFGWLLFFLVMAAQMAIGLRFRDPPDCSAPSADVAAERPATAAALVAGLCGIILVAAAAPAYARLRLGRVAEPVSVRFCLPPGMASAREPSGDTGAWRPVFPQASARIQRVLDGDDRPVDFFVAYYWTQGPGRELVGWGNQVYDARDWRYLEGGTDTVDIAGGATRVATARLAGSGQRRREVWYWYWIGGQFVDRPLLAKLIQARTMLVGGDQRSAMIAVSADETGTPGDAQQALEEFLAGQPDIRRTLEGATADSPGRSCP